MDISPGDDAYQIKIDPKPQPNNSANPMYHLDSEYHLERDDPLGCSNLSTTLDNAQEIW